VLLARLGGLEYQRVQCLHHGIEFIHIQGQFLGKADVQPGALQLLVLGVDLLVDDLSPAFGLGLGIFVLVIIFIGFGGTSIQIQFGSIGILLFGVLRLQFLFI